MSVKKILFLFLPVLLLAQENHYNHGELHWQTIETKHFFINFHNGAERTARVIANVAEDIYGPVTSLYQHEPDQKVSFIIKDYDDYSNGAAYFYDNKIEIWAPALDFDLRGTHTWLRNVIAHEFTHIIQIQTSMKFGRRFPGFYFQWLNYEEERRQDVLYGYPNTVVSYPVSGFVVPSWFAEGVAQYNRPELSYDFWDSHRDMILRSYVLDGNMLSWSEMSVFGKTSLGNESSYNAGFALSKYISETYGQDVIPAIAKNISRIDNVTIDQAIERTIRKSGIELYREWKNYLTEDYQRRVAPILSHNVEGTIIGKVGFGNFYPAYSPDGTTIAYTSNKEADYFGLSGIYLYNRETKKERLLHAGVHSSLAWSPDGKKIYYSKITNKNPNGSQLSDLYVIDIATEQETRLTHGLRALNPSLSPDGSWLCFTIDHDGTMNIAVTDSAGNNFQQLTDYQNGEQAYVPKWSADGKKIAYSYSIREEQNIAEVTVSSKEIHHLITGENDSRNPFYSPDGNFLYFVSDRTGIFNLYRFEFSTGKTEQLTNVLGGVFMPSVNENGDAVYSLYTSQGFKIAELEKAAPDDFSSHSYLEPERIRRPAIKIDNPSLPRNQFDFVSLRNYDDTKLNENESKNYKSIFSRVSLIPFLRIDNYNTKSVGLDFLKPGFYFLSSDVLEKFSMFGGAAINHRLERDLFLIFEYRDRVIGFKSLGWYPTFSLEMYNITRKSSGDLELGLEKFNLGITYGLAEFDVFIKNNLFSEADVLTLGFSYSRYSTDIGSFILPGDTLGHPPINVPASGDLYFKGNDFSLEWKLDATLPSRTREINPVGRTFFLRLDYEINHFNSTGEYEATETGLTPKLTLYKLPKAEFQYTEHLPLPFWIHTLSFTLRGGTIFGPQVPDFFDYYAGGLVGMKGYPFYSIGGNKIAVLNAAYRFPLWQNIDVRFLQIYFDKLYGEFHADYGNAWNGLPTIRSFKRDVGFELRLETFSWYAYPTRIFFNGTYGLDTFSITKNAKTVSYGKEWRFYFGVLFGFDFSNNVTKAARYFIHE